MEDEIIEDIESDQEDTAADASPQPEPQYTEAETKAFERAKAAEARLKEAKNRIKELEQASPIHPAPVPTEIIDELRLTAQGISEEEMEQAKAISKGKGISLSESLKDPLFVAYQRELQETKRKEKSKLGASKRSGQEEEISFQSGLDEDKHKELWKETVGK